MAGTYHKDLRPVIKELRKRGYTVAQTKGQHVGVWDASGTLLYVLPGTPGNGRWLANARADLKRLGLLD